MNEQDLQHIWRAIELAAIGLGKGLAPFGAVVVQPDGTVIGEGYNHVAESFDPSSHGEVMAIKDACQKLKTVKLLDCTLYTSCEPCLMCTYVAVRAGISRIVYSARANDVPERQALLGVGLPETAAWINAQPDWRKLAITPDVLREETVKLFANYKWT